MNRLLGLTLGAAALSLSVLAAAPAEKHVQKVEKVDLSDLRDGETRTLGKGDGTVTATRKGDVVTIAYGGNDGDKKTLKCTVGKDSCYAMTVDGEGKTQMVIVDKSGKGGKEADHIVLEADHIVLREGDGEGKGVLVFAPDEDGDASEIVIDADHPDMTWVTADGGNAVAGVKVIRIRDEAVTLLECPEGDATLTLKKGEENSDPYFCPKHNVKMEKAKHPAIVKKVEVKSKSADDEESD